MKKMNRIEKIVLKRSALGLSAFFLAWGSIHSGAAMSQSVSEKYSSRGGYVSYQDSNIGIYSQTNSASAQTTRRSSGYLVIPQSNVLSGAKGFLDNAKGLFDNMLSNIDLDQVNGLLQQFGMPGLTVPPDGAFNLKNAKELFDQSSYLYGEVQSIGERVKNFDIKNVARNALPILEDFNNQYGHLVFGSDSSFTISNALELKRAFDILKNDGSQIIEMIKNYENGLDDSYEREILVAKSEGVLRALERASSNMPKDMRDVFATQTTEIETAGVGRAMANQIKIVPQTGGAATGGGSSGGTQRGVTNNSGSSTGSNAGSTTVVGGTPSIPTNQGTGLTPGQGEVLIEDRFGNRRIMSNVQWETTSSVARAHNGYRLISVGPSSVYANSLLGDFRYQAKAFNPDDPYDNRGYFGFPYLYQKHMNEKMFLDYRDRWLRARNQGKLEEFKKQYGQWKTALFGNTKIEPDALIPANAAISTLIPMSATDVLNSGSTTNAFYTGAITGNYNIVPYSGATGGTRSANGACINPVVDVSNPFMPNVGNSVSGATSFAGPLPEYRPDSNDGAVKILQTLVGDPGGLGVIPGGVEDRNIQSMFMIFNTAIAAIAALYFSWSVLSAAIQGAHDGEFLGKRYHSYWMPIRTTIGASLIIPIPAIGFSIAQIMTLFTATIGIGIANLVAEPSLSVLEKTSPVPPQALLTLRSNHIVPQIEKGARCAAAANRRVLEAKGNYDQKNEAKDTYDNAYAEYFQASFGANARVVGGDKLQYQFGLDAAKPSSDVAKEAYSEDQCGTLTISAPSFNSITASGAELDNRNLSTNESARAYEEAFKNASLFAPFVMNIWGHYELTKDIPGNSVQDYSSKPLIKGEDLIFGQRPLPVDASLVFGDNGIGFLANYRYDESAVRYIVEVASKIFDERQEAIEKASAELVQCGTKSEVKEKANQMGWIGVGLHSIYTLGKSGEIVANSMASKVKMSESKNEKDNGLKEEMEGYRDVLEKGSFISSISQVFNTLFYKQSFGSITEIASMGVAILALVKYIFLTLMGAVLTLALTLIAVAFIPGSGWVGTGFLFEPFFAVMGPMLSVVFLLVMTLLVPMVAFGIKLALVIPMIPVIYWVGVILDWIVIVVESLIAAPYWALAHLEAEGEGMGQRTAHGYIFFLNLLFRPAICVIVFSILYTTLTIILGLANEVILSAVSFLRGGGDNWISAGGGETGPSLGFFVSLLVAFGAVAFAVVVFETMLNKVFSMLNIVPNNVFTWIGGSFGSNVSGDMASGIGSAGGQSAAGGASAAGRAIGGGGMQAAKGAGAIQQKRDQKASQEFKGAQAAEASAADGSKEKSDAKSRMNELQQRGATTVNKEGERRGFWAQGLANLGGASKATKNQMKGEQSSLEARTASMSKTQGGPGKDTKGQSAAGQRLSDRRKPK